MLQLEIIEEGQVRTFALQPRKISIGRQPDNDIVLGDKRASRYHCTLEPTAGGYLLNDLGSRNGTRVNDERTDRAVVASGDTIRIGRATLNVVERSEDSYDTVFEALAEAEVQAIGEPVPEAIIEDEAPPAGAAAAAPVSVGAQLKELMTAGQDLRFSESDITLLDRHHQEIHAAGPTRGDGAAVRMFRTILMGAFRTRATDIHFEPQTGECRVRFRVDGMLVPVLTMPRQLAQAVLSVVKVLGELDITRRNFVQESSFAIRVPGRTVDSRVSFTPTVYGQKLALRLLDRTVVPETLDDLGMPASMLRSFRAVCAMDSGMVLVSGPTGSGKTTTLYTAIRSLDTASRNVITIEDPVEYHLDGVTQTAVDAKGGLTFVSLLTSMLRQDPDVILVGEIRDPETARTAMQAAMTGHLVFATLHARDTIGSIFRLIDLGLEPYMVANALTLCVAQRLVRVLCEKCKRPYRPSPSQLVRMKMENRRIDKLYTHVGCRRCMNVGFLGRMAIFETLSFNDEIRDALLSTPTIHQIRKAAGEWSFQTLLESGFAKVAEGLTTIEEVDRVATQE